MTARTRHDHDNPFLRLRECHANIQVVARSGEPSAPGALRWNPGEAALPNRGVFTHRHLAAADGIRLHAVGAGDRGRVIVFLHGFPEFWMAWHRQLEEFARDHRALALDLRGYHQSDKPRGVAAYALPRVAEDIAIVLREISPNEPAIVVGHDWGGLAAWQLARADAALLDRVVIINAPHPVLFGRILRRSWRQRFASSYALFFQLRGVAELALRARNFAWLRRMVFGLTCKPENFPPALRTAYLDAWRQPGALTSALNYYRNGWNIRAIADEPPAWRVTMPVLVLWGQRDPSLLIDNLQGLAEIAPRAIIETHPAATHWIVHEEPEWVNARIRQFLSA